MEIKFFDQGGHNGGNPRLGKKRSGIVVNIVDPQRLAVLLSDTQPMRTLRSPWEGAEECSESVRTSDSISAAA